MLAAILSSPPARRAGAAAEAARRTVVRRSSVLWAAVRRAWRLSLQLRIVTITLVASGALVGVFCVAVATQITDQLLDDKIKQSDERVRLGGDYAAEQLATVAQRSDPGRMTQFEIVVAKLATEAGKNVVVALDDPIINTKRVYPDARTADVAPAITPELRQKIRDWQRGHQIRTLTVENEERKYLVFGTPVNMRSGMVELYYFFPLDSEDDVAQKMTATVAATGIALVLLLAVIAGLVTRLVVRPVRLAARTAERLSAGLLDQRMEVPGEDDLAMLASSFNQMAVNLQRQIQRLEEMSRLQRRFTSDVSHELRTPLTTVRMAADLIFSERESFDPVVARSAELLQLELDRFEELLTDLLEISRFDAGFAVLDAEPADLVAVTRRAAAGLSSLAARAGIEIELALPGAPMVVEIDARRVERILRNLIGNAVEHAEGRPVQVTLAAEEGAVAITVRDHGIGLKPGEAELVFNRFWRADPSRARQTGGTGLGLSISLEDARLHGGWLEAWGAPGQGAQFRLTLPLRPNDRLVSSPLPLVPEYAYPGPDPGSPISIVDFPGPLLVLPPARSPSDPLPDAVAEEPVDEAATVVANEPESPGRRGPAQAGPAESAVGSGATEVSRD